ncbi:rRNA maturation RNase YbeY [Rhodohalobacter mucosus]|uniref:Endoribonuclease YbeY n=2 Tax=Rhodohalobacter mucosus TaxID=2079485 RepID=A0A316TX36_9BACT|nr:rRNA maturation RNase YbeY [Rhodohalobacter mucosus]
MQIVETHEKIRFRSIELVYVDEKEILRINREYLDHDYITDIITFSYDESSENLEGTIFCCAPRILEQSIEFGTDTADEFLRVFVHGLIHLAGYNDKTDAEKSTMTRLENRYLELLENDS